MGTRKRDQTSVYASGFVRAYEYRVYTVGLCAFGLAVVVPAVLFLSLAAFSVLLPGILYFAITLFCLLTSLLVFLADVVFLGRRHLELWEEGLQYRGLGREINSSWGQIRKVRLDSVGRAGAPAQYHTIITEVGKVPVSTNGFKPTDAPPLPFFNAYPTAMRYYTELFEEIRKHAAGAQW